MKMSQQFVDILLRASLSSFGETFFRFQLLGYKPPLSAGAGRAGIKKWCYQPLSPLSHFHVYTFATFTLSLLSHFCHFHTFTCTLSQLSAEDFRHRAGINKFRDQPRAQFLPSPLLEQVNLFSARCKNVFDSKTWFGSNFCRHFQLYANCESRNLQTISGGCPALPSSLSFGNNSVNFRQPADHCFRTTRLNGSTNFHPGTELHQNSFYTSQRTSRCYETLKPNCCWLWWLVWLFYLFVLLFWLLYFQAL